MTAYSFPIGTKIWVITPPRDHKPTVQDFKHVKQFLDLCIESRQMEAVALGTKTGSVLDTLQRVYEAGGKAWDDIDDPEAFIAEIRGENDAKLRKALEAILRWARTDPTEPVERCLYEIEELAKRALAH